MDFRPITAEEKPLLYHLLQKYLYEMTNYYEDDLDEMGNYPYPYFDAYFTDRTRQAFLFLEGDKVIGFALLNRHSELGREIDHAVAEFCILPKYRRDHAGMRAVQLLFKKFPGRWEVKYAAANLPAVHLWHRATELYGPEKHFLPCGEEVLTFFTGQEGEIL